MPAGSSRKQRLLAHAAMILAQCIFGGYNVVAAWALDSGTDALVFCLYRDVLATITLVILLWGTEGLPKQQISRYDLMLFAASGISGIYVGQYLFVVGLNMTSTNVAAILQPLVPIWTVVMEAVVDRRMPRVHSCVGALLSVAGAGAMAGVQAVKNGNLLGFAVLMAQTFGVSVYFITQKPLLHQGHFSALTVTVLGYCFGTVCIGATALRYVDEPTKFHIHGLTVMIALIYSVLCSSCAGFALMTWANQHISASMVALYCLVQPIATALLNLVIHGTGISWSEAGGAVLVALGLVISNMWPVTTAAGVNDGPEGGKKPCDEAKEDPLLSNTENIFDACK